MSVIIFAVGIGAACYVALCLMLFVNQARQVYVPDRRVVSTPSDVGLAFDALGLKTPDGETVSGWYVPAAVKRNGLTLLFCHGNGGDIADRLDSLINYHGMGFNVLLFDYRGYGTSTGRPSENGTYIDARTCWDYLVTQRGAESKSVVVLGRSLGGAVAAELAVKVDPLMLIIESAFTSAPDMAARMFPFLPSRLLCRYEYDCASRTKEARCPVVVAHSRMDMTVPFEHGQKIFEQAEEPKRFIELSGEHAQEGIDGDPAHRDVLTSFINKIREGGQ